MTPLLSPAQRQDWLAWRLRPLEGRLPRQLAELFRQAFPEASDAVSQLCATQAAAHLQSLADLPLLPSLLALLAHNGLLASGEAAARLDLSTWEGLDALSWLASLLDANALGASLARLPWDRGLSGHAWMLERILGRAIELGLGEQVVTGLQQVPEPRRSELLGVVLPRLSGEARRQAWERVARHAGKLRDPLDRAALLCALLPPLSAEERRLALSLAQGPAGAEHDPLGALRAWVAPGLAEARERCATRGSPRQRLRALADRLGELGPLLEAEEARRWLQTLLPLLTAMPEELSEVARSLPPEMAGEVVAALPIEQRAEARVWLSQQGAPDDPSDLARLASVRQLLTLLHAPNENVRREAALALLSRPAPAPADEVRALLQLAPSDERRSRAERLLRESPWTRWGAHPCGPFSTPETVKVLLDAAGVASARAALERTPAPRRQAALLALLPSLAPDERAQQARAALASPVTFAEAGALLQALPEPERRPASEPHLARALALPAAARWRALDELSAGWPEPERGPLLRELYATRRDQPDFDPDEVFELPHAALDPALRRERLEREATGAHRPYTAWHLGWWARDLPEAQRGLWLDLAIAEFERIALQPTGPGNDSGPFCGLADLLDAERVRRALGVVRRMSQAAWGSELDAARESLLERLAALGHRDEALAALADCAPPARAGTLGAIAGATLTALAGDATDCEAYVEGFVRAARASSQPWPEVVLDQLAALVQGHPDAEARRSLAARVGGALTTGAQLERWWPVVAASCDALEQATLRLALAGRLREGALARQALPLWAGLSPRERAGLFEDHALALQLLTPAEVRPLWEAWLGACLEPGGEPPFARWADPGAGEGLPALILGMLGPEGSAGLAQAIDELGAQIP